MGKKSSKAPKAPDPMETARAQAQMNIDTALAQNAVNQVNQVTPDGSLIYTETGRRNVGGRDIPIYTATTTLSPEQQRIKAQSDAAELNLASLANDQSGFLKGYMAKPFDGSNEATEARLLDLGSRRLAPRLDEARRRAETDAANRGLRLGSDAYDRLMRQVGENESDAWNQLLLTGNAQAFAQAKAIRDQPINEISALLSGAQVSSPGFVATPQAGVAGTDYSGGVWNKYNADMAAYQQEQQEKQAMLGGLFTAAAMPFMYSDRRLKTDIRKVGETPEAIGIYRYRHKGGGPLRLGLIAQDVEKRNPEAVARDAAGYRMVDYRKALRLGEHARAARMDFGMSGNAGTGSPQEVAARRALTRSLMARHMSNGAKSRAPVSTPK